MRRLTTFLFALLVISLPAAGSTWSRAGLFGADVRALVADPRNPDLLYLGTSQGEVYSSSDGGASWTNPRGSVPFPGYVVENLLVDSRGRLWAASWGLWRGGVIAVSSDGGKTWERRDKGVEELSIRAFAVSPHELVAGGLAGVYRSRDDGRSWVRISHQVNVGSVAIDPRNPDTIYIGTFRQAWRTDDGGKSWTHIANGMVLDTDVSSINICPKNPDDIWISTCGWVYNSLDRGQKWTRYKDGFENRRIHTVERHPLDDDIVFAGSVAGLYVTLNRGASWALISPDTFVVNAITIHPQRPERIVLGTEADGVYVSEDAGKSWRRSSRGLHNVRVASVIPDPEIEGQVYATVTFGGSASGLYVSSDGGANWSRLNQTPIPEILSLAVRKGGNPRFVAGTERGFFYSADGVIWERADPAITPVRVDRILEYSSERLFAATALGVFTSKDGGRKWYRLGLEDRTIDIALGWIKSGPALYALTAAGLKVYDGTSWTQVKGLPVTGTMLAVRRESGRDLVVVAGAKGIHAGWVDEARIWNPSPSPVGGEGATAFTPLHSRGSIIVSFNDRHEIHLRNGDSTSWERVGIPTTLRDLSGVAEDPFRKGRFYLGTHGQGVLIWDASEPRAAASNLAVPAARPALGGGSR
ncbi:MAG: YCF48-related protein [Thermoanaerobaculia bacterium]